MNTTLIPIRLVLIIASIATLMLFVVGILFWNTKEYACLNGKGYYGDYVTIMAIGKLEVRAKPWGCTEDQRYDPKQFKNGAGSLSNQPTQ